MMMTTTTTTIMMMALQHFSVNDLMWLNDNDVKPHLALKHPYRGLTY